MCDEAPATRVVLPPTLQAPGLARAALRAATCRQHPVALDEAQLLVSELVTNAIRHGGPPVELRITCAAGDGLRIQVSDSSPIDPQVLPLDEDSNGGRGMALVDLLSTEWGIDHNGTGKQIWFRLAA